MPRWIAILCATVALAWAPSATGQDDDKVEKRFRNLEKRLARTEAENAKLRAELDRLKSGKPVPDDDLEAAIDAAIRNRERDDVVTWDKLTRSGNPIEVYGFIRFDMHHNTARANNELVLFWVLPEDGVVAGEDDSSTAFQARWTRIGVKIDAGEILDADTHGRIEIDFGNYQEGTAEAHAAPRIRLAYVDLDWGDFSIRFGQDWDLVGAVHPSVHLSGLFWNCGNLGDRRPMVAARYDLGVTEDVKLHFASALTLTGAVDNQDLDRGLSTQRYTSTDRDGFDSGWPGLQARAAMDAGDVKVGLWGLLAALETDTRLPTGTAGGENDFVSYCVGTDVVLALTERFSIRGEAYVGQALSDLRGAIGQSINVVAGDEIRTYGGWVELGFQASDVIRFVGVAAIDNPLNRDLSSGAAQRTRNLA